MVRARTRAGYLWMYRVHKDHETDASVLFQADQQRGAALSVFSSWPVFSPTLRLIRRAWLYCTVDPISFTIVGVDIAPERRTVGVPTSEMTVEAWPT